MSIPHFVDLCSDDEAEAIDNEEVMPCLAANLIQGMPSLINSNCRPEFQGHVLRQSFEEYESPYGYPISSGSTDMGVLYANQFNHPSALPACTPICRQFWKAGDYDAVQLHGSVYKNGQNRLRVHPKFLHSNATSHKWAFGALAELLDNAVDEVQNGASFVVVDKITNARDGNPALLIQDDGGGMDPESLRHCMSFGFSNKQSNSSIGQYGNGFKTSTMRLGADVIVFSRCMDKRNITQSIGLLSYTFLRQTNCDDIVVPMVDYEIDPLTGAGVQLIRHGQKQFYSNLSTLLRWSPFATEAELLNQFSDMGHHGTKLVVFNLWFNDNGDMELDFDSDAEDIMISGAPKIAKTKGIGKLLDQNHIASRFRYSLQVYSSILYLHLPVNFRIILRGQVVEPHHIVKDLKYCECIQYKPQVGGSIEHTVITTIGFLEGAPHVSIHGFNVYHKNRLILPFWPVLINTHGKGRGVAGVLEVNFMKPTHNKQDFERSNLYQKLESRLRDMTKEYWNYHCHLVGYPAKKTLLVHDQTFVPVRLGTDSHIKRDAENLSSFTVNVSGADSLTRVSQVPTDNGQTCSSPEQLTISTDNSEIELPRKRRHVDCLNATGYSKNTAAGLRGNQKNQPEQPRKGSRIQKLKTMVRENKKLQTQCVELEKVEKQLLIKVQKLREGLQVVQQYHDNLLAELKAMDEVKAK